jgi:CHASE2 domain-containing sensor protein
MIHQPLKTTLNKISSLPSALTKSHHRPIQEYEIIIDFGSGTLETGFPNVTFQVFGSNKSLLAKKEVALPATSELPALVGKWRNLYCSLVGVSHFRGGIKLDTDAPTNISVSEFDQTAKELKIALNEWLRPLEHELLYLPYNINQSRLILVSDDDQLQRVLWDMWELFERFESTSYALSASNYQRHTVSRTPEGKVRILAVLGEADDLDLEKDRKSLDSLPASEVCMLRSPSRAELDQALRDPQGWDILFFGGHSQTLDNVGILQINDRDCLTPEDIKSALTHATKNGAQLAIFNSCDGLGLAHALEGVGFSHVILMREPIPDPVAQAFLRYWLSEFARGGSFHLATRRSRNRLKVLEKDYPGASWLPVIYQNPATIAPTWRDLQSHGRIQWRKPLGIGLMVALLVIGGRATGVMQSWEMSAYDAFLNTRPAEDSDPRILLVLGQNEDRFGYPFPDRVLAETITTLQRYQPRVIGLDIFRDTPRGEGHQQLQEVFRTSENLIGVCTQEESELGERSNPPIPPAQMGYANTLRDGDNVLRRIPLFKTPDKNDACRADHYLGAIVALSYLAEEEIVPQTTDNNQVQIGDRVYPHLPDYVGAYQHTNYWGYEVMINYRAGSTPFQVVTIADLLDGQVDPSLIRDRLVIIGSDISNADRHRLPIQDDVPGVKVVAHVASQILATALDNRPQIWVWTWWSEIIWIASWAVAGSFLGRRERDRSHFLTFSIGIIVLPVGCWLVFALQGGWIPLIPTLIAFGGSYGVMKLPKVKRLSF